MLKQLKKTFLILGLTNKKYIFFLSFLTVIRTALEVLSVGMIIPFLSIMTKSENSADTYYNYSHFFLKYSKEDMLILIVGIFLFLYLLKTIFTIFFNYKLSVFLNTLYVEISNKIFENYLNRNYIFFSSNNSSKLIRNITGESNIFTGGVVGNLITLISNFTISFAVCIALVFYNFNSFYVIIFIVFLGSVIVKLNGSNLKKWGSIRQHHASQLIKKLHEVLGNIKEIFVYKNQKFFLEETNYHLSKSAKSAIYKDIFLSLSAPIMEFLSILIFFSFFLYLAVFKSVPLPDVIILFGVFAFATIKLLPNLVNIVRAFQLVKYNASATDIVYEEIINNSEVKIKKTINNSSLSIDSIELKNISFTYSRKSKKILENVDFKINSNDKIALIGQTGSGKTTLLNIFSGLLEPTAGEIAINKDCGLKINSFSNKIGYVSQSVFLSDETISFNVAMERNITAKKLSWINELITNLHLQDILNNKEKLNTVVGEGGLKLSGGQIQRLGIARALYRKPQILFVDEATASLDKFIEEKVLEYLFSSMKNGIVIFSTHRKKIHSYCNKILEINDKKLLVKNNRKYIKNFEI